MSQTIASIQSDVAAAARVSVPELLAPCREARFNRARCLAMALSRRLTPHSRTVIGRSFRRTSWTVLHAEREVDRHLLKHDHLAFVAALLMAEAMLP